MAISTSSPVLGPSLPAWLDAVHHGVRDQEAPVQQACGETERSQASIACGVSDFDIRGRVDPRGHLGSAEDGRPGYRPTFESRGNTWYNSTSTSSIFVRGAFKGINPVIVARLMNVVCIRAKSSAVSVSTGLGRWDSAPSLPSGLPVLKKKVSPTRASRATPRGSTWLLLNLLAISWESSLGRSPLRCDIELAKSRCRVCIRGQGAATR